MDEAMQLAPGDDSAKKMRDLVSEIARALVDKPEEVSVETISDGDGILLRLHVAQSDVGKVIGKQGRTARSVRTVLSAASMKLKRRFSLDIVEEGGPS
ncbi:MAG: KH domain-containing protein [Edaphobacter sp.]